MSKREPIFKDRKSAIITVGVIIALILFAVLAIDRTSVNRFAKLERSATAFLEEVLAAIEERFGYARTVGNILAEEGKSEQLRMLLAVDVAQLSAAEISGLYVAVEAELATLQRSLYEDSIYKRLAPYFEEIYRCELLLIEKLADYNEYAAYFNKDIKAFPGVLTAQRLQLVDFDFFDFGSALKSRP